MSEKLLDGSVLEGGGQLVRNGIALSVLLAYPIRIFKVRNGRSPPGLMPQHVAGVNLAADICGASLSGANKGSSEISFHPKALTHGNYVADPGTAGSTTLLMQLALPCLLFADMPSTLILRGGTNAAAAPQIDYMAQVFLPFLARQMHVTPELTITRRGYYPRGGGEIVLRITPVAENAALPAVTLTTRGAVIAVRGRAFVAGALPRHIADRMGHTATMCLISAGIDRALINVEIIYERPEVGVGSGSGIILWAETEGGCIIGGSAVGAKGMDAGKTGVNAAKELLRNLKHEGCVDEHLQDQIIIFLALAKGKSTVATGPLSLHTKTAIWLAEQITDAKFHTDEDVETGRTLITCEGVGLTLSHT